MRDIDNNIAFSRKITLHNISSIKPWSNQPSTPHFIKQFRNFTKRDRKSVDKTLNESARSVRPGLGEQKKECITMGLGGRQI